LRKLKSTDRKFIEAALNNLSQTLDVMYERILTNIEEMYHEDALSLLRWIAFADKPLTLNELSVAASLRPSLVEADGDVADTTEECDFEGPVNILAGLVIIIPDSGPMEGRNAKRDATVLGTNAKEGDLNGFGGTSRVRSSNRLRLAHFSVEEFLVSSRILDGKARYFYLEKKICDLYIAHSCVTYIKNYSASNTRKRSGEDLVHFPLLKYAVDSWSSHLRRSESADTSFALSILSDLRARQDWVTVRDPKRIQRNDKSAGGALYHACALGLLHTTQALLDAGADVNTQGGDYSNPLQAAAALWHGNEMLVQMLLDAGADVNAQGGFDNNALQAASIRGSDVVVRTLLNAGADVNAQGGYYGNALPAASLRGYDVVVQTLLDAGADVNAQGGPEGSALQIASAEGYNVVVRMLLDAGADVNAQGGLYGNALQAASLRGYDVIVRMLLDAGADVDAQGGPYGSALQASSVRGHDVVVRMLLDAGADVNAQGGHHGSALQAASTNGHDIIVRMLLDAGANVDAQGGYHGSALQAASTNGHDIIVRMLLDAGAVADAQGGLQ
jgi:ankyrin repeat protein